MKKLLVTIIAFVMYSSSVFADSFGFGVSGSLALLEADGKETENAAGSETEASVFTKQVENDVFIGSIFAEYISDFGVTVGIEHTPGSADVSDKTHTRSETAVGVSGADTSGAITRTAAAEIENFNKLYVEYGNVGYVRVGFAQLDVNTQEKAQTDGGTYGNTTLDGYSIGFGFKHDASDYYVKSSIEYTDFDTLSLTSTSSNKLTADLDVTEFKIAIGKAF